MAQSFFFFSEVSTHVSGTYTDYSVNMMVNGLLANRLHNRHYWQLAEQCMRQIALQIKLLCNNRNPGYVCQIFFTSLLKEIFSYLQYHLGW